MPEIKLSNLQKELLKFIGSNRFGKNFYWTGGTLLSYQYLHHRGSVDLDFFSDDLFADEEYLKFADSFKKEIGVESAEMSLKNNRRIFLLKRGRENVKLELVFFPFPAIERRKKNKEFDLRVDSLADIMVNKILSTYQRNEVKDVYDLFLYLNRRPKYKLSKLIDLVEKKFSVKIEPTLLLAKIMELSEDIGLIKPLLFDYSGSLNLKMKYFFQNEFDKIAGKFTKK